MRAKAVVRESDLRKALILALIGSLVWSIAGLLFGWISVVLILYVLTGLCLGSFEAFGIAG